MNKKRHQQRAVKCGPVWGVRGVSALSVISENPTVFAAAEKVRGLDGG